MHLINLQLVIFTKFFFTMPCRSLNKNEELPVHDKWLQDLNELLQTKVEVQRRLYNSDKKIRERIFRKWYHHII